MKVVAAFCAFPFEVIVTETMIAPQYVVSKDYAVHAFVREKGGLPASFTMRRCHSSGARCWSAVE